MQHDQAVSPTELIRVRLRSDFTAEEALLALRSDDRPFALLGAWAGGGAIVGSDPIAMAEPGADPFEVLCRMPQMDAGEGSSVGGGWFGYLGYGLGGQVETLPPAPPRPSPVPRWSLGFYDHVLRLDSDGAWWFEALWTSARREPLEDRRRLLEARLSAPAPEPRPFKCGEFISHPTGGGYCRAVEECLAYIGAGDLYQANLASRLEATFDGSGLDLFARAVTQLQPPYSAYFAAPGYDIASLSPELFLQRRGRSVMTAPIKGTRPRPTEPLAAAAARRELSGSAKDQAENVMIADLMRNDLGRVCEFGSVTAEPPGEPEAHPGVWHLVSRVRGELRVGVSDADLLRATFPPGSVTGAPKIKAQEVICTLESTGREAYTGAIGYASPVCGLELNVAIRTFEAAGARIWLGAGAGIVADSDPSTELAEAMAKAAPLVAAIGSEISRPSEGHPDASARSLPRPGRLPRPDPGQGVLETLLVLAGAPVELEGHLHRLALSARSLYGEELDIAALGLRVAAEARSRERARIRIHLAPGEHGRLELSVECALLRDRGSGGEAALLVPQAVPGGLGSHKWIDRRLVEAVAVDPGREALICDLDGTALETGTGNLWIVSGGVISTPRADGRILPGVTRGALLEIARDLSIAVRERDVPLGEIAEADEIFVSSSLRGVRSADLDPARKGRTGVVRRDGAVRRALTEGLKVRWAAQPASYSAI